MPEDKIQLSHPDGKKMPKIDRIKFEKTRSAILACLKGKALSHAELIACLKGSLNGKIDGNISWYGESMKLHLEAIGAIERFEDARTTKYRLT